MNKKEIRYLDPESNNHTSGKLINNSFFTNYEEELKALQRSIALLRQDLPKIVHDELIKLLNERRWQRI
jgi:hypothetical protein